MGVEGFKTVVVAGAAIGEILLLSLTTTVDGTRGVGIRRSKASLVHSNSDRFIAHVSIANP